MYREGYTHLYPGPCSLFPRLILVLRSMATVPLYPPVFCSEAVDRLDFLPHTFLSSNPHEPCPQGLYRISQGHRRGGGLFLTVPDRSPQMPNGIGRWAALYRGTGRTDEFIKTGGRQRGALAKSGGKASSGWLTLYRV